MPGPSLLNQFISAVQNDIQRTGYLNYVENNEGGKIELHKDTPDVLEEQQDSNILTAKKFLEAVKTEYPNAGELVLEMLPKEGNPLTTQNVTDVLAILGEDEMVRHDDDFGKKEEQRATGNAADFKGIKLEENSKGAKLLEQFGFNMRDPSIREQSDKFVSEELLVQLQSRDSFERDMALATIDSLYASQVGHGKSDVLEKHFYTELAKQLKCDENRARELMNNANGMTSMMREELGEAMRSGNQSKINDLLIKLKNAMSRKPLDNPLNQKSIEKKKVQKHEMSLELSSYLENIEDDKESKKENLPGNSFNLKNIKDNKEPKKENLPGHSIIQENDENDNKHKQLEENLLQLSSNQESLENNNGDYLINQDYVKPKTVQNVDDELSKLGLVRVPTNGDGNCLLTSIFTALVVEGKNNIPYIEKGAIPASKEIGNLLKKTFPKKEGEPLTQQTMEDYQKKCTKNLHEFLGKHIVSDKSTNECLSTAELMKIMRQKMKGVMQKFSDSMSAENEEEWIFEETSSNKKHCYFLSKSIFADILKIIEKNYESIDMQALPFLAAILKRPIEVHCSCKGMEGAKYVFDMDITNPKNPTKIESDEKPIVLHYGNLYQCWPVFGGSSENGHGNHFEPCINPALLHKLSLD